MLSEQTTLTENLSADTLPIRFITTDDGRTLLAVSEQNNSMLEIMATPVTFVQQHDTVSPTFIKTADGNFILHSPIFQISVESISENGIQQAAVLPVHTVDTPIIVEDHTTVAEKDLQIESTNCLPITVVTESSISLEKNSQSFVPEMSVDTPASKSTVIRSPGRPKKSATTERVVTDLKCDICGQTFLKQTQFRKHMEHHAEEKPHRCPKCPASFNVPTNFTLHMATHNTGEPKCPECGRKFARMASLKSHMLLHEKEENLFCTECEDAFLTRAQLEAHQKLHGEKWSTEDVRKCKLCNKQFVQPALYRLHIREHYRLQTKMVKQTKRGTKHKTMYKCTICLKSFQKPSQLMRHIRVHTGEKPFKCNTCGRAFTQKSSLQIHMWQHKGIRPHACNLCNAKFSQKGNLNAHILRVHNAPEGEPIYGCTHCSCVFKKLGSLNGHMKRMHSNPVEEVTPRCDSSIEADMRATVDSVISQLASLESGANEIVPLTNTSSMNTNKNDILQQALKNSGLQSKNKNLTDELLEANKNSGTRTSYVTLLDRGPDGTMRKYLTIKQRCIGSVRWYACSSCHKEFKKPSDLIRHIRVHTQEKPFKCSYCYRSFALKSTMIAHERTHIGTKKYACGSCDKTFACHSSLTSHTRLHIKPHKCTICDKSFCAIAMLKNHMKSHSKGKSKLSPEAEVLVPQIVLQEPLVISDAGNKISVAHIQSKQGQGYDNENVSRPHKCWVCQAAFRKVSHFKQHYRRHTGERPYKCTKCERRFTSNSVLKSHLHTHDEIRPYSCSICSTKFSTQSSMKRHLVTHSNKRPFMCPYCHKTFKTSVNCRKHMKIHKHELAQQQLEHQQTRNQSPEDTLMQHKETVSSLSDNIVLSEDMEVSFQPQMAPDFAQAFSDQFQSIPDEKEKSFLSSDNAGQSIVNSNMAEVDTTNLESSQTLHADETGTITLPNYSGDQTLTAESIREIEETLNQQLFSIGMNFGLGNNLAKHMDDTSTSPLETREQPVLNIIYENNKNIETSGNPIFTSHFDSFDISQISLQPDSEIDMGLNTPTSTSMSSILPRSTQEQQPISVESNNVVNDDQVKISSQLMVVNSEQSFSELSNLVQICTKFPKIIAKADTTGGSELMSTSDNIKDDGISSCEAEKLSSSLTCHLCNKTFRDSTQLKAHIKMHTTSNIIYSNDDGTMIDMPEHNSLLQCHMCNERGFTAASLKEHLKKHRGTKEYQCPECSLRFCTNGGLSRHLKMHTNKQQWKCSICHKILSSRVQLKLHNKIHDNNWNVTSTEPDSSQRDVVTINANLTRIGTSDGKLSSDSSVSEKVLLDTVAEREIMDRIDSQMEKKETKEYTNKCKYCPKTFRKPSDLIRHIRTHTGERPYKCNYCSKSFAVKCTLDSHTKVHTGKKTFCCHVCNSLFATKGSLKVHMRLHTGSKPFRCTVCDLRFRTSGHRKVHMLKHAREHKGSPKRKQKHFKAAAIAEVAAGLEKSVEAAPQTALIDDIRTVNYTNLETIGIEAGNLTNQITFNADGTILNNNSMLTMNESNQLVANLHFMLANGLFTIQADDTLISQPTHCDLNVTPDATTVNEIVTSTLEVPCSNTNSNHIVITSQVPTDNTTSQANHTMLHLNNCISMMQGDRRNDTIKPEQSLARQANKGTQSKKECDICGKTFRKPYQVERHKRIHTGERPYKCDLCTKSFAQKSTLQMHQKHHTGDRPHPCPHCEHSFTQKCNLQTHLKRVHQLGALEAKKVRRGQQILSAKLTQDTLADAKILNLDDISFVELLK